MALKRSDPDTIAAVSTPAGQGGLGVIRISGPAAFEVADRIFRPKSGCVPSKQKAYTARYGHVSAGGENIDEALCLVMRAPKSFTGEDTVELSVHGGAAVLSGVMELTLRHGARTAEPGEFTKRAFLNGRIDLVQAEAVAELVAAKTPLARRWAVERLEGAASRKVKGLKDGLIGILSHLEAEVDFPDDLPGARTQAELVPQLENVRAQIEKMLADSQAGSIAQQGLTAAIVGAPNVGKSSLLNALARRSRAIVTPFPGTTRDVVEETVIVRGFPLRLLDTAGIRDPEHPIEQEGIERSKRAAGEADLVLYVLDGSRPVSSQDRGLLGDLAPKKRMVILNKSDLANVVGPEDVAEFCETDAVVRCSCVRDEGTRELEDKIHEYIAGGRVEASADTVLAGPRQRDHLEKALNAVRAAEDSALVNAWPELVAVDVRLALDELGALAGEFITDELLDVLFSHFCIGK